MTCEYIEDYTEAEPKARSYGDKQILVAGECEDCVGCNKCQTKDVKGNQSKEYYDK